MSEKINPEQLKKYANEFSKKIANQAFESKKLLGGGELLKLTPLRQINQEVIAKLSDEWKKELSQFKSRYFDLDNPNVKLALTEFSNVVSQHIALRREDLEPWLLEATEKALLPIREKDPASEEIQDLVSSLSAVLPLNVNTQVEEVKPVVKTTSFFDIVFEEVQPKASPARPPQPEAPKAAEKTPEPKQSEKAPEPQPLEPKQLEERKRYEAETINSRFKREIPAETDDIKYGSVRRKVDSIYHSIPLGQRFMFVSHLFQGSYEAFENAIDELDRAGDFEKASTLINDKFKTKFSWNMKDEAAVELTRLVRSKYS